MNARRLGLSIVGVAVIAAAAWGARVRATGGDDFAAVAWIAGSWAGTDHGVEMEEHWIAPKGGAMLGVHRDVKGDRMVSFEFLRIVKSAKGIEYLASPGGRPATSFPMVESGEKRVVFENKQHDFPQRILYWLDASGSLHAKIEGPQDGKTVSEEWTWKPATK